MVIQIYQIYRDIMIDLNILKLDFRSDSTSNVQNLHCERDISIRHRLRIYDSHSNHNLHPVNIFKREVISKYLHSKNYILFIVSKNIYDRRKKSLHPRNKD